MKLSKLWFSVFLICPSLGYGQSHNYAGYDLSFIQEDTLKNVDPDDFGPPLAPLPEGYPIPLPAVPGAPPRPSLVVDEQPTPFPGYDPERPPAPVPDPPLIYTQTQYFQGDILMRNEEELNTTLWGRFFKQRLTRRATKQVDISFRWPNADIPYKISRNFSNPERAVILEAMEEFRKKTCIRFIPWDKHTKEHVHIIKGKGCYTYVGRQVNLDVGYQTREVGRNVSGQVLSLGDGCLGIGTVTHELGHVAGLSHTHSREDRDSHINIIWIHVIDKSIYRFQFNKTTNIAYDYDLPYDIDSLLHYPWNAFAQDNTTFTISQESGNKILHKDGLSQGDVACLKRIYECKASCSEFVCPLNGRCEERSRREDAVCVCNAGYTMDEVPFEDQRRDCVARFGFGRPDKCLTCRDVDECEHNEGRGECDHSCQNVPGSYICSCPDGSHLMSDGKTCKALVILLRRPCSLLNCNIDRHCSEGDGVSDARCICNAGFIEEGGTCKGVDYEYYYDGDYEYYNDDDAIQPTGISSSGQPTTASTTSYMYTESDLWHASETGDVDTIVKAAHAGINLNWKNPSKNDTTALHAAAITNKPESARALLRAGAENDIRDIRGMTPLYISAWYGSLNVLASLMDYSADVDIPGKNGSTPLMVATYEGHQAIVQTLLDKNADTNASNLNGETALHVAAIFDRTAIAELLLNKGIDARKVDNWGMTAEELAKERNHEVAQIIQNSRGRPRGPFLHAEPSG